MDPGPATLGLRILTFPLLGETFLFLGDPGGPGGPNGCWYRGVFPNLVALVFFFGLIILDFPLFFIFLPAATYEGTIPVF